MSFQHIVLIMLKAITVLFIMSLMTTGTAEAGCGGNNERLCKVGFKCDKGYAPVKKACKPCGRKNQPACQAARRGPQCYNYLEKINGKCVARGGQGEKPYSGPGFDCKPGKNVGRNGKCTTCGGHNQPACEPARKGTVCKAWHERDNGYCYKRGGNGQEPYKKSAIFSCRKGYNVGTNGKCTTCGGNNQPACEIQRKGDMCKAWHERDNGYCYKRGGEGEDPFQNQHLFDFDCRPGFNLGSNGKCTACGGANQIACEWRRLGTECDDGLTKEDGICKPDLANEKEANVKAKAEADIVDFVQELLAMTELGNDTDGNDVSNSQPADIKTLAEKNSNGQRTLKLLKATRPQGPALNNYGVMIQRNTRTQMQALTARSSVLSSKSASSGSDGCFGSAAFKSFSVGLSGDVGVSWLGGAAGDTGWAFRCAEHASGQDDSAWYGRINNSTSLGASASLGVVVGLWVDDFDEIGGDTVGLALSINSAITTVNALSNLESAKEALKSMKTISPDLSIALWYEDKGDDGVGRFKGLSITISGGVGIDAGGAYVESETWTW